MTQLFHVFFFKFMDFKVASRNCSYFPWNLKFRNGIWSSENRFGQRNIKLEAPKTQKSDFWDSDFLELVKIPDKFDRIKVLNCPKNVRNFSDFEKIGFSKSNFASFHVAPVARWSVLHANTHGILEIFQIYWRICQWKSEIHEF